MLLRLALGKLGRLHRVMLDVQSSRSQDGMSFYGMRDNWNNVASLPNRNRVAHALPLTGSVASHQKTTREYCHVLIRQPANMPPYRSDLPCSSQVGKDGNPQLRGAIGNERDLLRLRAYLSKGEIGQRRGKELVFLGGHAL